MIIVLTLLPLARAPVHAQAGPPVLEQVPTAGGVAVDVSPPPGPTPDRTARRLRVGGYIELGLGSALLGLTIGSVTTHLSSLRWLADQEDALGHVSPFQRERLREEARDARTTGAWRSAQGCPQPRVWPSAPPSSPAPAAALARTAASRWPPRERRGLDRHAGQRTGSARGQFLL